MKKISGRTKLIHTPIINKSLKVLNEIPKEKEELIQENVPKSSSSSSIYSSSSSSSPYVNSSYNSAYETDEEGNYKNISTTFHPGKITMSKNKTVQFLKKNNKTYKKWSYGNERFYMNCLKLERRIQKSSAFLKDVEFENDLTPEQKAIQDKFYQIAKYMQKEGKLLNDIISKTQEKRSEQEIEYLKYIDIPN
jgi:hypothetical protein